MTEKITPTVAVPTPRVERIPAVQPPEEDRPPVALPVTSPAEMAAYNLAQRLGIKAEEIAVQSVEAVEWPDTSLGCPQPGMMYAQVITPGYRILLRAGGKTYEYHSDQRRAILCQPQG